MLFWYIVYLRVFKMCIVIVVSVLGIKKRAAFVESKNFSGRCCCCICLFLKINIIFILLTKSKQMAVRGPTVSGRPPVTVFY